MPELNVDASATLVYAIRYLAPARNLFLGIDAGGVLITLTLLRDLARLGHQQAGGCTLPVIFDGQWTGHHAGNRPVAGKGRHHKSIGESKGAKLVGLEEFGRLAHFIGVPEKIAGEEQVGIFYRPGNAASYSDIAG
jgi:hypothetical protein